ncbi:Holliday junction branch migration protein RuvA [Treponema sp.]|uniref:Holliday junction branch migration protein RuvA n=1 Tax=Treponema sp. TaxID=166 RepID=UPI0025E2C631|nr:Holliday junction branch migration protein RuvA [Treponema sp.]MCR5217341.1 Holliday junction branch migration protein RuvA [Treponema sp.]
MFNSLTGTVTGKFPQKIYLENNGIEWDIICPETTVDALPPAGSQAKVYTWLQHTDALMNLYGFASMADRELFFDLLKVDGIGPKGAVKIMSAITCSDLVKVLENGDLSALEKVPGVGKKTAGKMLLQLKGKLSLDNNIAAVSASKNSEYADVITGLVDMGYDRQKVMEAVEKISSDPQFKESFAQKSAAEKEDYIFRQTLLNLAR